MTEPLAVTILHEIPGRLRVRLSHALADAAAFGRILCSHAGIEPIRYTPVTRTVLLRFDPTSIQREELLVRLALALSLEHDALPVRIEANPPERELTASVAASGALLLIAGFGRAIGLTETGQRTLDRIAGLTTGSAVFAHAAQELRQQGAYHPEVVSVAYLAVGMLRGNIWPAAVLTWFASFGRHLLKLEDRAIEVRPGSDGDDPEVVACAAPISGWQAWLRLFPAVLRAIGGAGPTGGDLLANLHEVSKLHDQVLDSLGPWKKGIPLRLVDAGSGAPPAI